VTPKTICNRCLSLVGLPDITILDVEDVPDAALRVHVEMPRSARGCPTCGVMAHVKDRRRVELVDLSMGGRPMRLVWVKRRFRCPESSCLELTRIGSCLPCRSWRRACPRVPSDRIGAPNSCGERSGAITRTTKATG
jgi:transposase